MDINISSISIDDNFNYEVIAYDIYEKRNKKYEIFCYWSVRSKYLRRYIVNTIISLILNVELNEKLYVARNTKKPLNYYELRLTTATRNIRLDLQLVSKILKEYLNAKQVKILDYTIFEAIYYFRIFAIEPRYIDNLILIHKYTTELWENGSKYMHFYTLHNQSHAVQLIKNINSFIKAIDYFKISKVDYYILYIACYLHDISMVIYPKEKRFLTKDWDDANLIYMSFIEELKGKEYYGAIEQQSMKELLLNVYKKIDTLFENEVRVNHAKDSANYIRDSKDLLFVDESILDIVAEVSYSHGMDCRDIYHLKSLAKNHLVSKKHMMVLIRLADLFDMSENRVSIPLFYKNKENMSSTSKFHWISHLITGKFNIINTYKLNEPKLDDNNQSYFKPKGINEIITIEIDIHLNQLTTIENKKRCNKICMRRYDKKNEIYLDIKSKKKECKQEKCNFLCKWFMQKNDYIIEELYYLQNYLEEVESYFKTSFVIKLKLVDNNVLRSEDFDDLKNYIST
ncbi:HD domain-containing protein [Clostridium sp.]|jgi:hypothetical protein|uniref:HD domain-containing protein n=1 Tax=Clostridium sp. TaxID=1506 RepID=UPI003EED5377